VTPGLRVLTGIARPDRWPELRPAALEVVWSLARRLAATTVVDCGFALEAEDALAFDSGAPRRNGATFATLEQADLVLAVGAADPVGMARLVRGLDALTEVAPTTSVRVVINRVRRGPVGPAPERQLVEAIARHSNVDVVALVPDDRDACDLALRHGRTLAEVAPMSPARLALAALAAALVGRTARPRRRGLRRGA
jgi:Flp pilus assembly CpaE family ATPase